MREPQPPAEPLSERYWYVEGTDARRVDLPVGEFWSQVMSGAPTDPFVAHLVEADGWLVTQYHVEGSTDHEEMHPEGDELHYLVSGDFDLVLVDDSGTERTITMRPGAMANVPRGSGIGSTPGSRHAGSRSPPAAAPGTGPSGALGAADPEHPPAS